MFYIWEISFYPSEKAHHSMLTIRYIYDYN